MCRRYRLKQLPKRSGEYFFEVITRRHATRSTMMTSSQPLDDSGKLVGDVPAATAILDRFLHHAEVITLKGRSYRLKDRAEKDKTPVVQSKQGRPPPAAGAANQKATCSKKAK